MSEPEYLLAQNAHAFAKEHNLPIDADLARNDYWQPRLTADEVVTQESDRVAYISSQIDYLVGDRLQARRVFDVIPPERRSNLRYIAAGAPEKVITTHASRGLLLAGSGLIRNAILHCISLDADGYNEVTIPPGYFYVVEASKKSALQVSTFQEGRSIFAPFEEKIDIPERLARHLQESDQVHKK